MSAPTKAKDIKPKRPPKGAADVQGANGHITKAERTELRRLIKTEFDLLAQGLSLREGELREEIRKQVIEDSRDTADRFTAEVEPLLEEAAKIRKRIEKVVAKAARHGVTPGSIEVRMVHVYERTPSGGQKAKIDKETGDWVQEPKHTTSTGHMTPEPTATAFVPADLEGQVNDAMRRISSERGLADFDMAQRKADLERELIVGAIASGGAKEFIERIPKLDELLPAPDEAKALMP